MNKKLWMSARHLVIAVATFALLGGLAPIQRQEHGATPASVVRTSSTGPDPIGLADGLSLEDVAADLAAGTDLATGGTAVDHGTDTHGASSWESSETPLVASSREDALLTNTWPVGARLAVWPHAGRISSPYGARRGGFHNGLDIAAPFYTPVRAAASGVVQMAGNPYIGSGDTAMIVMIAHASNLSTLYGHLEDRARPPAVTAGQRVSAGQVIAYVGTTGYSTGPHTHFSTIYNGRVVNPVQFLP
jgi:murein DD-endopeptidase MepM/ murein hydrolase activator NlpD